MPRKHEQEKKSQHSKRQHSLSTIVTLCIIILVISILVLPADASDTSESTESSSVSEIAEPLGISEDTDDVNDSESTDSSSASETTAASETTHEKGDLTPYIKEVAPKNGVEYNADTNTFSVKIDVKTSITVKEIVEYGMTDTEGYHSLQSQLPASLVIPDSEIREGKKFYLEGKQVGIYEFVKKDENTFFLVIDYLDDYVNNHTDSTKVQLNFTFDAMIGSEAVEDNESLKAIFNGGAILSIPLSEVTYPGNDNYFYNIQVKKQGDYAVKEDILTYTAKVTSSKGTPDNIQFVDTMTLPSSLTLKQLLSVSIAKGTGEAEQMQLGELDADSGNVKDENTYYYDGSGVIRANLPKLESGESYTITYNYQLNSVANGTQSANIKNSAYVESSKGNTSVASSDDVNLPITKKLIQKSSQYVDSKGKWVIVVNESRVDIAGSSVVDTVDNIGFANACKNSEWERPNNIAIWNNTTNQTGVEGTEFNYVFDDSGHVTSIAFLAKQDSDGDGVKDSNTDQFTITYYTPVSVGENNNTAQLQNLIAGSDKIFSVSARITVSPPSLTLTKTSDVNKVSYDEDDNILIPWTVTFTPVDTLEAGAVMYDLPREKISGSWLIGDKQYMSLSQINAIYNQLGEDTESGNALFQAIDKDDFYVWVNSADVQNIKESAYKQTQPTTNTVYRMVNYESLLSDEEGSVSFADGITKDTIKYHGFGFQLSRDLPLATYSFSYKTTGDMSDVTEYQNLNNYAAIRYSWSGSNVKDASTDTTAVADLTTPIVEKFAISGSSRNNNASYEMTKDGSTFNWTVWVKPYGTDHDSITVVDTLPKGITLEQIWTGNKIAPPTSYQISIKADGTLSGSRDGVTITGSLVKNENGTQTVTLTFKAGTSKPAWFTNYKPGASQLMNIIYTCSINEEAKGYPEAGESGQFSLTNNVDVYYNEDKDNDAIASNTITATIDRVDEVKKTLEKVGSWDDDAKLLTYSVEANPYGEDLVSDTATLTLTDELSYTQSDTFAASLLMDSVKLYYATVGTDADGNATLVKEEENGKFKEVESLNWSWKATETEQKNDSDTTTVVKTITAKIPDSTPVILEYQYHIQNMVKDSPPDINNSVSIGSTEYETSISGKDQSDWQDVNSDVNVEITPAYTLYKVDAQSYSTRLAGAKFALYGYSSGEWKDTGIVLETDKKGIISISKDDFSTDTTQESYEEVDGEMTLKLQSNVAYYLVEIEAPKGYNKLDNPSKYYFYCEQLSSSNTETHYPSGWKTSDDYGQAINLAKESATNYVENVRPTTNAQVTLNWTINNEAALEHPDSMIVYLNQYAITQSVADKIVEETGTPLQDVLDDLVENKNEETSVTLETQAKQVLSDSNAVDDKWVYTWTGLPAVGADVYYYYEVEVDMESLDVAFDGEWTSTCVDSCEQAAGSDYLTQINYDITNDRTVELYNLPATGGRGTAVFYILGVALMALALMGYVIIKTKKKKTNEK